MLWSKIRSIWSTISTTRKIITKTFENVIENIFDLQEIDFLNIDCEGHDYSVLKGFNLKRFNPKLICIETHKTNNQETDMYKNIINLLYSYNYNLVKRCGPSSIFDKS